MKTLAHNWYYAVGLLIVVLLGLHYSGAFNTTEEIVEKTAQELIEEQQLAELQKQIEKEITEVNEFEPVVTGDTDPTAVDGYTMTGSGLQYQVVASGAGSDKPTASDTVRVHYHGTLLDGTVFDSSKDRGEPAEFPLYRVIPGWTEGLQLMSVGDTYNFIIPAVLAYGDASPSPLIPGGSTLQFEVELLEIKE